MQSWLLISQDCMNAFYFLVHFTFKFEGGAQDVGRAVLKVCLLGTSHLGDQVEEFS